MSIMSAGLAALPPADTNLGSALNNVARQTAGALGLAVLNALSTSQQAQLFADRAALIHSTGPTVVAPEPGTFAALFGRYQALAGPVLATSYATLFLIIAVVTGSGALLALFMRSPNRSR